MRKAKPIDELRGDPRFPFHIGQLIGASEMVSHWMRLQEDPNTKAMGQRLAECGGWFFVGGPIPIEGDDVGAWPPEAETRVK